jgi:hypothetical protein
MSSMNSMVNSFRFGREEGTGLPGIVAEGDYVFEFQVPQGIDILGRLPEDVDPGLGHDLDSPGVHVLWLDAGGIGLQLIGFKGSGPALGHNGYPSFIFQKLSIFLRFFQEKTII